MMKTLRFYSIVRTSALTFRTATFCALTFCAFCALNFCAGVARAAMPVGVTATATQDAALEIEFSTVAQGGETYTWSFGDGTSASGALVQHDFPWPGNFLVTLETDDGGLVTEDDFWLVVGDQLRVLDFEQPLPVAGWNTTNIVLTDQPGEVIRGGKSVVVNIVNPDPGPSCAMPQELPEEPPIEIVPRRWVLSALVDLVDVPSADGSSFDVLRIFDDRYTAPIFGAGFESQSGVWRAFGYAAEGLGLTKVETPAVTVTTGRLLVELQAQLAFPAGSLRLRVSEWPGGQELVSQTLGGLDNSQLENDSYDFGFLDGIFPGVSLGAGGALRLDDFRLITGSCLPPDGDQLVGFWDFEDSSQLGHDSSGDGRHGVAQGGASSVTGRTVQGGGHELALDLDGTGHLEIANLGLSLVDEKAITVEAWVKVAAHSQMNLFRAQQPLAVRSNGFSVSNYVEGSGWESVYAPAAPPTGEWYHLAAVFDAGEMLLYINGALVNSKTVPFDNLQGTAYTDWALGARTPGGSGVDQFFDGQIDDVKIYRRVLSPSEIQAAAGLCGSGAPGS